MSVVYEIGAPAIVTDDAGQVTDVEQLKELCNYPSISEEELLFRETFSDAHRSENGILQKYVSNGPMELVMRDSALEIRICVEFCSELTENELQRLMDRTRGIWLDGAGVTYCDYISEEFGFDITLAQDPETVFLRVLKTNASSSTLTVNFGVE